MATQSLEDGTLSIENYSLGRQMHEDVLQAVGFRDIR
jgi:hypothetical protein